jgi:hypothetical protein
MLRFIVEDVDGTAPQNFICMNTVIWNLRNQYTSATVSGWYGINQQYFGDLCMRAGCELIPSSQVAHILPDNKPTFYLVTVPELFGSFNPTWVYWLKPEVLNFLIERKIPILITQVGEYENNTVTVNGDEIAVSDQLQRLVHVLDEHGLHENTLIFHNSTLCMENLNMHNRRVVSVYSRFWLEHSKRMITHDNYGADSVVTFEQHMASAKPKEFLCLNRMWRDNRPLFLLSQQQHLHLGEVSCLGNPGEFQNPELTAQRMWDILNGIRDQALCEKYSTAIPTVSAQLPMTLSVDAHSRDSNNQNNPDINQLRKTVWYEVVNETYHNISEDAAKFAVITEKSFRPILNQMPFVNNGYRLNHQLLNQLGFQDFREEFDLGDYDGAIWERMEQLNHAIQRLSVMSDDDKRLWLARSREKILHNFDRLINTDWAVNECQQLISAVQG